MAKKRKRKKPAFYSKLDRVLDGAGTPAAKAARIRRMIEGVK